MPKCGIKSLLDDEAVVVGGTNHSHATKDLYDAIAAGDYPEWALMIQVCVCWQGIFTALRARCQITLGG